MLHNFQALVLAFDMSWRELYTPHFAMYNVFLCVMRTYIFDPNFQEKKYFLLIFKFNYLFIYI